MNKKLGQGHEQSLRKDIIDSIIHNDKLLICTAQTMINSDWLNKATIGRYEALKSRRNSLQNQSQRHYTVILFLR